ncbi:MAG TPA: hypothetical protein VFY89_08540 [Ktedonobacterales bacterium]
MATNPKTEREELLAQIARELREHPERYLTSPPDYSDEELAAMEQEDERMEQALNRLWDEMARQRPELRNLSLSDLLIAYRDEQ